jgi:hypothetical protein
LSHHACLQVFATILAMIAEEVNSMLLDVRSGKAPLAMTGHILLLNWNQQVCEMSICHTSDVALPVQVNLGHREHIWMQINPLHQDVIGEHAVMHYNQPRQQLAHCRCCSEVTRQLSAGCLCNSHCAIAVAVVTSTANAGAVPAGPAAAGAGRCCCWPPPLCWLAPRHPGRCCKGRHGRSGK